MRIMAGITLAALLVLPARADSARLRPESDAVLRAAFIFNFAKFTEWPLLPSGAPIEACIYGDDAIAAALQETVAGQSIVGHAMAVRVTKDSAGFRLCHLLFIGAGETRRTQTALTSISAMPVLTVSDGKGFAETGGIIEMYVEDGRMRFAINVSAAERSGLRLSSRLLGLARIVRGLHVP